MSHFTTICTQVRDIDALRAACSELGIELLEKAQARGYAGQTSKGDFVVRLKGPYDVAVNRQPDGTYGLTTDWWSGDNAQPSHRHGRGAVRVLRAPEFLDNNKEGSMRTKLTNYIRKAPPGDGACCRSRPARDQNMFCIIAPMAPSSSSLVLAFSI